MPKDKIYQPGQVAAALFSKARKDVGLPNVDTGALALLFSPSQRVVRKDPLPMPEIIQKHKNKKKKRKSIDDFDEDSNPHRSYPSNEGFNLKTPERTSEIPGGRHGNSSKVKVRKTFEDVSRKPSLKTKSTIFIYQDSDADVTLENAGKETSSSAGKKRKSEEKNDKEGKAVKRPKRDRHSNEDEGKRPRRDRHRDKTTDARTIFVGNCPLSADKKALKNLFKEYGKIETIRFRCAPPANLNLPRRAIVITKNFHEQGDSYVAYVVFASEDSAHKALERNGHLLDKHHLRVDIAAGAKKHDKKRSLFVGNLPFNVHEEEIRGHFEDCGDISNIRIVRDRLTSLGKGICYVQFDSSDSVSLALKLNGSEFKGRPLRVMNCASKPKKKEKDKPLGRKDKPSAKQEKKKISFAPSNLSKTSFKVALKTKREKRLRQMKKKKETHKAKNSDGLSAIFGDIPAAKANSVKGKKEKPQSKRNPATGGKTMQKNRPQSKKQFSQKGSSFKGKGLSDNKRQGKGKSGREGRGGKR